MNRENLQKMAEYIKKIPQKQFSMAEFRTFNTPEDLETHKCNTIGDVIGHCTVLDIEDNLPRITTGVINFNDWSVNYTGLYRDSAEWIWCFSQYWVRTDNTPTGAAKRIEWLLNNGLPSNYRHQITGKAKLCYL